MDTPRGLPRERSDDDNGMSGQLEVQGIDVARLARWMDEQRVGAGPVAEVRSLGGGTQNVVVEFGRGRERFVLRRPPVAGRAEYDC